ncbi:STE/STE11/CDC15 protein kinase [Venturia nashicola]|uniref:non-specific serine/threonine protein kinase n=1 Tax=Venturia nashicola TaxID=86259 RepID=A0A4Z1NSS2_9PEZI|nr:STE/STE11/CDC15 protein kinase [Venturia nashicola]TLD18884.1 STE/STE11/CDC15 protein kinase [Venturia nashicola]
MVSHSSKGSHGSGSDKLVNGRQQQNGGGSKTPGRDRLAERGPSKDGSAQRAAADVEGLKGYQLGDCLGKGAFGSVYRALNWGTGQTVAIKQVRLTDLPKNELKVIMSEIDLLKNLNHPNIVKYQGFVKSSENLYIILEYCENGSLHFICKNFGKFPENLVALYMSQVLQGLLYLHEQGVIHRDIKGANILTTKDGLVKLADFGVATKSNLGESSVVGTPYWMSPEVIQLSGATTASDIWSLGCTVIELLAGKPPYHNLQPMPALFRIVNDDHPPFPEGASPAVCDFLMQCFQKDPNLRVSAKKLLKHPWILNAKRTDAVVTVKPTKFDEAVKSVQQWNEALKSPDHDSLRRNSRSTSLSPVPQRKAAKPLQLKTPAISQSGFGMLPKTRPTADAFRSPELDTDDNWDDDFASSISPSALQLPHLKPHDNFGGMLSVERLKSFSTFDSVTEESYDEDFNFTTMSGPMHLQHLDPLETVRPYTPQKPKTEVVKPNHPNTGSQRQSSETKASILKEPGAKPLSTPVLKLQKSGSRLPNLYREDSFEDYSDLLDGDTDDTVFQRKVESLKLKEEASFSPRLFHPSDLKNAPKLGQSVRKAGTLRRYLTPPQAHASQLPRSRSELEIQKYAEDENEDPEDFLEKDLVLPMNDSDSGSERSTPMMLNSKLSTNSWLGDEEEEDDPFAQLEEGFDEMDLETNVARDKHARLCKLVEELVGALKFSQHPDLLADISEQLMQVLVESPELKNIIISSHGMLPILEILDSSSRNDITLRLLKIVNMIIFENEELQENLCFVGGIPIVTRFANKTCPDQIRLQAAAFVRQMYQGSTLTRQMFIGCGGLNVLCDFLEEDLENERDLVLIGVNGVWSVFELQGPTPKNDFCRILSRNNILYPLSLVLNSVLDDRDDLSDQIEERIVNIFYLFSQAENYVKEIIAGRMILKRILKDLKRMSPIPQITMLKFVKNLSMLDKTHEALENANTIEILTDLLKSSMNKPHFLEISNQVLNTMYNLCRLSKTRQEEAALHGIVPILQKIVKTERPLKEFALPILCDMAHSGKQCRKTLWNNKGLQFYISLLADKYWQVTALDAIFIWLQEETARVEQHLLDGSFRKAIVECFTNPEASPDAFENFLDPLQKMLRLSPLIASTLAHPDLFSRTAHKLNTKKAVVRLNLLRIIRSICDASEDEGGATLIRTYGLHEAVERLSEADPAILVREMASELVKSCDLSSKRNFEGARLRPGMRRASSSTASLMTPQPQLLSAQSMPIIQTPQHLRADGNGNSYFSSRRNNAGHEDLFESPRGLRDSSSRTNLAPPSSTHTPSSSFRPTSRDGRDGNSGDRTRELGNSSNVNGVSGGGGAWSGSSSSGPPSSTKSRLPRTSATRLTRLSLANRERGKTGGGEGGAQENLTPTHTPGHQGGVPRVSSGLNPSRRRRQASGGDVGGRSFS